MGLEFRVKGFCLGKGICWILGFRVLWAQNISGVLILAGNRKSVYYSLENWTVFFLGGGEGGVTKRFVIRSTSKRM